MRQVLAIALAWLCLPAPASADEVIHSLRFRPDTPFRIDPTQASMDKAWPGRGFPDFLAKDRGYTFVQPRLWGDRYEYWLDDRTAQFLALLAGSAADATVRITLTDANGHEVAQASRRAEHHCFEFRIDVASLRVGTYRVEAALVDAAGAEHSAARWTLDKVSRRRDTVPIPEDGIPIVLEAQEILLNGSWPVIAGVPLPHNTVDDLSRFTLYENGQPVASQITLAGTWERDGSAQWMHVRFLGRYAGGQPARYRLRLTDLPGSTRSLVTEAGDIITVDTGAARFTVNRGAFAGINDEGGPYLVDETGKRFEARLDRGVEVTVEETGPVRAAITARGWYTAADGDRLCRFTTRLYAHADDPVVRITQETTITFDTWKRQLLDLGLELSAAGAARYRFGADGREHHGTMPGGGDTVFLHQDRHDRYRIVGGGVTDTGRRSDGWVSVEDAGGIPRRTLAVRDIWQKFPKELELTRNRIVVHFWPAHGHEAYTLEEQLELHNIYKFLCFHQGRRMDLRTPEAYVQRLDAWGKDRESFALEGAHTWWRESEHDATRDGRARGVIISNELAVVLEPKQSDDPARFAAAFQFDPTAAADPAWNCATGAIIPMAARKPGRFEAMEQAIEEGFLSWARGVERYGDYGMFNYADTHSVALPHLGRPGLHRIWQSSHYHNVETNWLMVYRTGSPRMLRWARANTDHYINIDMCNYVDREDPVPVRDHELGAMQHLGWKTHWASSGAAWGQYRGVTGHFIDPDGPLWCWYLTGNPRAKEAYDLWRGTLTAEHLHPLLYGTAREINNTFACILNLYRQTHDPMLLASIHCLAWSLRSVPLPQQQPGPMWHPWWMVRYHQQTRDPGYVDWILRHSYDQPLSYPWPLGMSAYAYELTGERKYLERLLPRADLFPRRFFRADDDPWDWFGAGPGPLGDGYAAMEWGLFAQQLGRAGIDTIPPARAPRGSYLFAPARPNYPSLPPSLTILALHSSSRPLDVRFGLYSFGGSLHATSALVLSPGGERLLEVKRVGDGEDRNAPRSVEGSQTAGMYRVEYRGHEAGVPLPQTNAALEAALLATKRPYKTTDMRAHFAPCHPRRAMDVRLSAWGAHRTPANVRVEDAHGKVLLSASLFEARSRRDATVRLDPALHPLPWVIDTVGHTLVTFDPESAQEEPVILMAANPAALEAVAGALDAPAQGE